MNVVAVFLHSSQNDFMKTTISYLIFLAVFGTQFLSAAPLQQNARPKADSTSAAKLPAHIKPAPDKISLFADFDHKVAGDVDLYLVNITDADVSLASQDGDLGSKREAKTENGKWMRCDSHGYSWCGNSYGSRVLKAGHFLAWTQSCDTKTGQAKPLRFKLYGQGNMDLVSNEGVGIVDEADVQFCRYDSLAMRHGSFEDVAAVVTGKVQGGQGASINGMDDAVRALERFSTDRRLFSVVKEVIGRLKAEQATEPDRRSYVYTQCLAPLQNAVGYSLSRDELWDYVSSQLRDVSFPWRSSALDWMIRVFEWDKNKLGPVLEEVLSAKGHPALRSAAFAYGKVVEKHEAGVRLAAIENDKSRSELDRDIARRAREYLFPNPYLSIKAEAGEPLGNDGDVAPLKQVTISNISPQAITLPVARPEALLVIEFSETSDQGEQMCRQFFIDNENGSLVIQSGQQVLIRDVKWWEVLRGQQINPASYYSVRFLARSPSLWDVPTQPSWGWMPKGDKILKALEISNGKGN
jgi:hypothetical protein